jgi:hypothetical protein
LHITRHCRVSHKKDGRRFVLRRSPLRLRTFILCAHVQTFHADDQPEKDIFQYKVFFQKKFLSLIDFLKKAILKLSNVMSERAVERAAYIRRHFLFVVWKTKRILLRDTLELVGERSRDPRLGGLS